MGETQEHTPGPWFVEDRRRAALKNIRVIAGNEEIAQISHVHQRDYQGSFKGDHAAADMIDAIGLANAAFIVQACNQHDELSAKAALLDEAAAALRAFVDFDDDSSYEQAKDKARAVLSKISGGSSYVSE